ADSRRMLSNYMLWLFPVMVAGAFVPLLSLVTLIVFVALLAEWFIAGRRLRAMAIERFGNAEGGAVGGGFYTRRRALPPPQVAPAGAAGRARRRDLAVLTVLAVQVGQHREHPAVVVF